MNGEDSVEANQKPVIGKFGWGLYIVCVAWIPLAVFEWYLHHSRDGLYIGLLLYVVTVVVVAGIFTLLILNRRRRIARREKDR